MIRLAPYHVKKVGCSPFVGSNPASLTKTTDSLEIIGMLNRMPASWSSIKDNRDRGK